MVVRNLLFREPFLKVLGRESSVLCNFYTYMPFFESAAYSTFVFWFRARRGDSNVSISYHCNGAIIMVISHMFLYVRPFVWFVRMQLKKT